MHMLWLLGFIGLVGSNPSRVGKKSGHPRGEFVPAEDTLSPNLMQGDIAVPESHVGGEDDALDVFVTDKKALWMRGIVHYRIEEDEYEGVVEPVFTDDQIANITKALEQIETEVPCIEFRCNSSTSSSLGQYQLFHIFRLVGSDYTHPHLIFSPFGDEHHPAYACYSFVGRQATNGQIINLGSPECLAIGMILHETLHGLGWFSQ